MKINFQILQFLSTYMYKNDGVPLEKAYICILKINFFLEFFLKIEKLENRPPPLIFFRNFLKDL